MDTHRCASYEYPQYCICLCVDVKKITFHFWLKAVAYPELCLKSIHFTYHIRPDYHTYPYKCTGRQFHSPQIRPNEKICVFRVTQPYLIFLVKPGNFFHVFQKKKIIIIIIKNRCYWDKIFMLHIWTNGSGQTV